MKYTKFTLAQKDPRLVELLDKIDKITLALWAIDCAERVMPYFEKAYPYDNRPRDAIKILQVWIKTQYFSMSTIRKASLDAHTAAKEIGNSSPAASVAHAAGQAVATAHVYTHAIGPAMYALQAIYRANDGPSEQAELEMTKEREWQYNRLVELMNN
ncbi:MAG: hypothetical protein Fur003_2280 [Candidatus Dojkabacteria bacterium]